MELPAEAMARAMQEPIYRRGSEEWPTWESGSPVHERTNPAPKFGLSSVAPTQECHSKIDDLKAVALELKQFGQDWDLKYEPRCTASVVEQ